MGRLISIKNQHIIHKGISKTSLVIPVKPEVSPTEVTLVEKILNQLQHLRDLRCP